MTVSSGARPPASGAVGRAAAQSPANGTRLPAAHPWRRFMGICYEGVILFGVVWFVGYGYSALTRFDASDDALLTGFRLVQFLALALYFVGFWRNGNRTLPMKTVSLQLVDRHDRPVGTVRALVRFLAASAFAIGALYLASAVHPWAALLLLAPGAWSVFDPDRQALYDRIAGTRLVTADPA